MENRENEVAVVAEVVTPPAPIDLGITEADKQLDTDLDTRTMPVAKEVLRLMYETEGLLTGTKSMTGKEKMELYIPMTESIIDKMIENEVRMSDIPWVFDMVNSVITNITQITERAMEKSAKKATSKLYGREDHDQIKVSDIDSVLKAQ